MKHVFIMVLDSFGVGAIEDAERFGDAGVDTLGHITEACTKGEADGGRKGPLNLPNLTRLGLTKAHGGFTDFIPAGINGNAEVIGTYAWTHGMSSDKDTSFNHWETAGVPVLSGWGYFSDHENSFPQGPLDKLVECANLPGYLGNCRSSGTVILNQPDEEHMKINKSVSYTSTDSVLQIACHEETPGLDKLYELREIAREELANGGYNVGRAIVCPFIGDKTGNFQHTGNRHDLAVEPSASTVLQKLADEEHGQMVSIGKVADTYASCGVTKKVKATGLDASLDAIIEEMKKAGDGTIVFANFVDLGSSWGHRRDVVGYAAGLELFDRRPSELISLLRGDDILTLVADHGYDPTWTGTDHTCEHIPVLVYNPKAKSGSLGHRETFADIGQALVKYFGTSDMEYDKAVF